MTTTGLGSSLAHRAGKGIAVASCAPSESRHIRPPSTYDAWIEFYLGFYVFPPLPLVQIDHGFDPFEDAMVSVERLRNRGADITVTTYEGSDHINTWIHAMPRAVAGFASLSR